MNVQTSISLKATVKKLKEMIKSVNEKQINFYGGKQLNFVSVFNIDFTEGLFKEVIFSNNMLMIYTGTTSGSAKFINSHELYTYKSFTLKDVIDKLDEEEKCWLALQGTDV